ncbi:DUF1062 domain-containing protein [Shinella sp. CPCC 100929]|uniref:DUF1062 domain-containing protein n=1 Tax=Shinella lacus TaxID=2654216 RepID=A0ABT1R049_9HYPH|nr:DUF1062 domain-containing protein [Shinella lacus]MCQ4628553.1 DUF1062 domain-containing protein [Shinella lacus]
MCNLLKVRWTIIPRTPPQPWIVCGNCGGPKPFRASDKLRLNANGKRLDAWLIYKCLSCDKTWNRPLFERQTVRDFDPATLIALQSNDLQWLRRHAFDIEALRHKAKRIDTFAERDIDKAVLAAGPQWDLLEITFSVPTAASIRIDRLLASELRLSRTRLHVLYDTGKLRTDPERKDAMRRAPKDGGRVTIDAADLPERDVIALNARGERPA